MRGFIYYILGFVVVIFFFVLVVDIRMGILVVVIVVVLVYFFDFVDFKFGKFFVRRDYEIDLVLWDEKKYYVFKFVKIKDLSEKNCY